MNKVKEITLSDGSQIYVEMEEIPDEPSTILQKTMADMPDDTELTCVSSKAINAMETLKNTIRGVANILHEGIKNTYPDEWTLELNIGFKGKANPIPVILSGESNLAIKIIAKWNQKKLPTNE